MCGKAAESVNHVLSECNKLDQKKYKNNMIGLEQRFMGKYVENMGEVKENWCKHKPEVVVEKDKFKILWDFTVRTDHEKYMGEDRMSLWYRKIKIFARYRVCFPLRWKSRYQRIRKNRTLPRFGTRVEEDMEHESQGYTISDRCHRNNAHKVKI